jgi:hypothetical protein
LITPHTLDAAGPVERFGTGEGKSDLPFLVGDGGEVHVLLIRG